MWNFRRHLATTVATWCCLLQVTHQEFPLEAGAPDECLAGLGGFRCAGATMVQQCVDGMPRGFPQTCQHGSVCDVEDPFGPCVALQLPPCCHEGTFAIPDHCRAFFVCVHSGIRLLQYAGVCGPGFEFSARRSRCMLTQEAGCSIPMNQTENTDGPPHTTATTLTLAPSTTKTTAPKPPTTTTTTTSTTTPTSSPTFTCPGPGQFPDPSSCRHFMVCTWLTNTSLRATKQPCLQGLFYDTDLKQCVWSTRCGLRSL